MKGSERGSAALTVIAGVGLAGLLLTAAADLGLFLLARSKAQTAADAAALAAAGTMIPGSLGEAGSEAERFAHANGARLLACDCPPRGSEAVVRVQVPVRFLLLRSGARYVTASARSEVELPHVPPKY